MKRNILIMLIATSILMLVTAGTAVAVVSSSLEWDGVQGTEESKINCTDPNFDGEPGIHWVAQGNIDGTTDDYLLTLTNASGYVLETATPSKIAGTSIHFYTDFYEFDNLKATLTFDVQMADNANLVISHYCPGDDPGTPQNIPEFPTVALPVAAILGLAFLFQRRKE